MDWMQFATVVSMLIGWTLLLTRQILTRMDKLVESAREQEQTVTDEFIAYLRESVHRTEESYERMEQTLHEIREVLLSLRHTLHQWLDSHKP
ncbi:hypothetical protein GBSOP10_11133 [Armatimonadetes bacterium GBS]|jgi:hypothetical protein|nr:hypothetical protein HRbin14_02236 [bacterium HR14]GIV12434.1 MAG: hypothetical protein KatS3mg021_0716 [Fimbriimonadales bacterium]CUU11356.1 hypothetical protein GBSOP10_11133 [Armatimonadetes bacterium GBS]CUU33857.1 hypothetical protein GXSOP10_108100 [Armatimonadetes bacterium GXS]CUU35390.1 hypothetical protein DCOP10_114199 [Armatimonadetes bacterium DC]